MNDHGLFRVMSLLLKVVSFCFDRAANAHVHRSYELIPSSLIISSVF